MCVDIGMYLPNYSLFFWNFFGVDKYHLCTIVTSCRNIKGFQVFLTMFKLNLVKFRSATVSFLLKGTRKLEC